MILNYCPICNYEEVDYYGTDGYSLEYKVIGKTKTTIIKKEDSDGSIN